MRRIDNLDKRPDGSVTYELASGLRVVLDSDLVERYGAAALVREMGLDPTPKTGAASLPVFQYGEQVGWMAVGFDPAFSKSTSWRYVPQPGDFRRDGDRWIACPSLGPGDFEAITDFQPIRQEKQP